MSLSARIVLRPSRRIAACEAMLMCGGGLVATVALIARWPASAWPVIALASASWFALVVVARRRSRSDAAHAITLSDRIEVGVLPLYDHVPVDQASWRLVEPTMVWPGFAVLGLQADDGARLVLPVLDRGLASGDRRALQRFLLWTLRGGSGRRAEPSDDA